MTENKTKRSPSYYKYKKEHPTVSFILNSELKEALDILKENRSYGQIMKQIIEGKVNKELTKKIKEMQDEVSILNKKLEYQKRVQRFEVPCRNCGQNMHFSSNINTVQWDSEIYPLLKETFFSWIHSPNCPEEK